jgi:hypothetical protein
MSSSGDVTLIRHEEVLAQCLVWKPSRVSADDHHDGGDLQVYMEGWLTKSNAEQRRWFVLTANTFAYFRDEVLMQARMRRCTAVCGLAAKTNRLMMYLLLRICSEWRRGCTRRTSGR